MDSYTHDQIRDLLEQVAGGAPTPRCPRCGGACAVIRVEPRSDVAYVRDRIVVRCSRCMCSGSTEVRG